MPNNERSASIKEVKFLAVSLMGGSKQFRECNIIINAAVVSCGAVGLIPVPLMDTGPVATTQVSMTIALGKVFDIKMTDDEAKTLKNSVLLSFAKRNVFKVVPVVGAPIAAASVASETELLGWSLAVDFCKKRKELGTNHNGDILIADTYVVDEVNSDDSVSDVNLLRDRVSFFLNGSKSKSNNKSEYLSIKQDLERIIDSLAEDDDLRNMYLQLCDLD